MCGVIGLLLANVDEHCRQHLFDGLTVLQHRGQDAAGMVTANTQKNVGITRFNQVKGKGMVRDVFGQSEMLKLEGNAGIGHCRYPTAGSSSSEESQPMYLNYPCGLALAHNGNLTNNIELQEHVSSLHRHLNTKSDSEALLNVFAEELRSQLDIRGGERQEKISPESVFVACKKTMERCRGGYAVSILVHDVGVLAFRDPWGIRPMMMGSRESKTLEGGIDYIFSSESVASDTLGFTMIRDIKPGECVLAIPMNPDQPRQDKGLLCRQLVGTGDLKDTVPCLFEYVYFARPDSVINQVSVHESRLIMGEKLAEKIRRVHPDEKIDVVIPVPDTSRISALSCAQKLGIPYVEGFVKNRYIGRTFIMPEQTVRKKNVRLKLNTIKKEFGGKNVLIVDDSIVRGTTSTELVHMARDAGANKVFFCSASPEIRYPNIYGIDLPKSEELVAFGRDLTQISETLQADWVLFQDLKDLEESVRVLNPEITKFEGSTFNGKYVTGDVNEIYFQKLSAERANDVKVKREYDRSSSTLSTVS